MPERQRTPGPVVAYLIPAAVVANAARSTHKDWLATNPNTKGDNRTWNLWFNNGGPPNSSSFAEKWQQYRLRGSASAGLPLASPSSASPSVKLGDVIAWAKAQIAEAAGVPAERVKITIDV
jgi:hypothetical protein